MRIFANSQIIDKGTVAVEVPFFLEPESPEERLSLLRLVLWIGNPEHQVPVYYTGQEFAGSIFPRKGSGLVQLPSTHEVVAVQALFKPILPYGKALSLVVGTKDLPAGSYSIQIDMERSGSDTVLQPRDTPYIEIVDIPQKVSER